ncbi:MAG TPA: DUF202 domain-containing protein [Ignavibacteria bacterium]|nr:DUF202 domain-containing protein [Ignavibacteria bacterium]
MSLLDNTATDNLQSVESELKISDKLAVDRTKLALERTQMAVIRTSVSMISFGFTIAKFFNDLKSFDTLKNVADTYSSKNVGFWLVTIGTCYIIAASIQYQLEYKALHLQQDKRRIHYTFLLSIVIGVLGLALLISFYTDIFSLGLNK